MSENIIEKALMFAIIAHSSQVRKANPEEPAIVHPIAVAEILRCYGADKNVISAAYLHDVAEDTKYTLQDIKRKFGFTCAAGWEVLLFDCFGKEL